MNVVITLYDLISERTVQTWVLQLLVLQSRCFKFVERIERDRFFHWWFLWGVSTTRLVIILPLRALFFQLLHFSFPAQHHPLFGRNVKRIDCAMSKSYIFNWLILLWKFLILSGLCCRIHIKCDTRCCVSDCRAISWVAYCIISSWNNFKHALNCLKIGRLCAWSSAHSKLLLKSLRLLFFLFRLEWSFVQIDCYHSLRMTFGFLSLLFRLLHF